MYTTSMLNKGVRNQYDFEKTSASEFYESENHQIMPNEYINEIFPAFISTDLPFIKIKQLSIKICIETGSMNSIHNPTIAGKYFL